MLGRRLQIVAAKPLERVVYLGIPASLCKEARDYNSIGISDQERAGENGPRLDAAARFHHGKPLLRQVDRRELLANAFDPGVVAAEEKRHVGAQFQAQRE